MMAQPKRIVTGGVDTHLEMHVAAVIDEVGRILATQSFPVTQRGYRQLHRWVGSFGTIDKIGVEGTGSYGAGLTRLLQEHGVDVMEVNRPNRQTRRRRGKSDAADAEAAARAALNGEACAVPKSGDGDVESIRMLRLARRSAVKARTQAANQIHSLTVNAPQALRERLEPLDLADLVETCARFKAAGVDSAFAAAKTALRLLSRRCQALTVEIDALDHDIDALCVKTNPALLGALGVKSEVASALLVAAGDNPERMHSPAAFVALCGASPVEASSGKITRHRYNSGGNRQANGALWRIVMVRLSCCERTRTFAARKVAEGKSVREVIRILKVYIAREIYWLLVNPPEVHNGADLRDTRKALGLTLADAAPELGTYPTRISRLERGLDHNNDLANRYHQWLQQQAA
jgi:transposase